MTASTSYPTALDTAPGVGVGNPMTVNATEDLWAAVIALQTRLGIGASATDGYTPRKALIRANAVRTFVSDTNLQAIFADPAGGALTLPVGTYRFELLLSVSSMSASSGNALLDILGAGTATTGAWLWQFEGIDVTDGTVPAATLGGIAVTKASPAAIATATTGTGLHVRATGTFEASVAGTLIPSLQQATAAAAVVAIGSYFSIEQISSNVATTSIGAWA